MDCCVNETSGCKEEGQHINGSIIAARDALPLKTIGEGRQEDKGEVDDHNTILPTPHHP